MNDTVNGRLLVKDLIRARAQDDRAALCQDTQEITYAELYAAAERAAEALRDHAHHAYPGGTIGLYLPNGIPYAIGYFAAMLADRTVTPIDPAAPAPELASTITYCETGTIITDAEHAERLRRLLAETGPRVAIFVLDEKRWETVNKGGREPARDAQDPGGAEPDNVAILLHTSGTTSRPKRVMLTHRNLLSNLAAHNTALGFTERDTTLIVLPMFFGYCNTAQFLAHIALGARGVIHSGPFSPQGLLRTISRYQVTNTTMVPSMLLALQSYRHRHDHDISTLKTVCFGGGVMPAQRLRELAEEFPTVAFVQTYGQTEAGPRVTAVPPDQARQRIGTIGLPIPGVEIELVDEAGSPVPKGQPGQIRVRSSGVMKGYYNRPEETATVLSDGWLSTGDLAVERDGGYLYLVGRSKNLIISGGRNIYPEQIEEHLLAHPGVAQALAEGRPDPLLGEIPHARVVLRDAADVAADAVADAVTPGQLKAWLADRLAPFQLPRSIEIVAELPRTPSGKTRRYEDTEMDMEMDTNMNTDIDIDTPLKQLIITLAAKDADPEGIGADSVLTDDLGIDSITLVQLIVDIETTFDIELTDEDVEISRLLKYGSLREVVAHRIEAARV